MRMPTVHDVALVSAACGVSGLDEDDDDCNMHFMPLSKNAGGAASLCVAFTATQMPCRQMSLSVVNKAIDGFGLARRGFDSL